MAHLVRDDRGELGRIIGQRQQAARHVEIAAGQREGVDVRRIEDGDAVGLRRDWPTPASGCRRPWPPCARAWGRNIRRHRSQGCADAAPLASSASLSFLVTLSTVTGLSDGWKPDSRTSPPMPMTVQPATSAAKRHCRGQAQAAAHGNGRSIVWRHAGGQDGFLSVRRARHRSMPCQYCADLAIVCRWLQERRKTPIDH